MSKNIPHHILKRAIRMRLLSGMFPVFLLICSISSQSKAQSVGGSTCVTSGSTVGYSVSGVTAAQVRNWCVTGGVISGATGTCKNGGLNITVTWGSGSIKEVRFSSTIYNTTKTINTATALVAGTVSPTSTSIIANTTAPALNCTVASGGNCGSGSYTYQWMQSTDGTSFTDISGATSQNYSPGALSATRYFRREATSTTTGLTALSNIATITVIPVLVQGNITSPVSSPITNGTSPGQITGALPTGGGCGTSYSYQWESSANNVNFSNISGAASQHYTPGNLTATAYYRRKVTCGTQSGYSNTVTITVAAVLGSGSLTNPASNPIPYNTSPGQIVGSVPAGGSCSPNYTYSWESSPDNTSFSTISGATQKDYTPPALTANIYYRRKVTCGPETKLTTSILIAVNPPPLIGGSITSAPADTIIQGAIPDSITATVASGGGCSGNYNYQWQYSTDGVNYLDDGDSTDLVYNFDFEPDSTIYIRRKVTCGTDSAYTGAVAIIVNPAFSGGTITTLSESIQKNAVLPVISASTAMNGSCGTYDYQWQISHNGNFFEDIPGQQDQNLTYTSPVDTSSYFRRKAICDSEFRYTNVIAFKIRDSILIPVAEVTYIDSLLAEEGLSVNSLFNILTDSAANDRSVDTAFANLDSISKADAELFALNLPYPPLEQADLDSMANAPAQDSVDIKMAISSEGGSGTDSTEIDPLVLSDSLVDALIANGNYSLLDSITNISPDVSFEEAFQPVQLAAADTIPDSVRTYEPTLNPLQMKRTATITGSPVVSRDSVVHYEGDFVQTVASQSTVNWVVKGGQVISINNTLSNGPVFVNIKWLSSVGQPFVGLLDQATSQYQVSAISFDAVLCKTYPALQELYYGQKPGLITSMSCLRVPGTTSVQYQWQVRDVYGSTGWTDIPGATNEAYQPVAVTSPWLMYRRLKRSYNSSSTLIGTNTSTAASVKTISVQGGTIQSVQKKIQSNTVPVITGTPASGGFSSSGTSYQYSWEYSLDGGVWQSLGTSAAYPNFALVSSNTRIRRVTTLVGAPAYLYNQDEKLWKGYSNELVFDTYYQTVDYENRNYVRENVVLVKGVQTWEQSDMLANEAKSQSTNYLDGLSRSVQVVGKAAQYNEQNAQWYDFVQPITYGAGGRVDKMLMPYPSTQNIGKYKNNSGTEQQGFYQTKFGESKAYSTVEYDNSPLNRVLKSFAPGNGWVGSGINTSADYEPYDQAEGVRIFTMASTAAALPVSTLTFPAGFILKSHSLDEKGKKVITYVNTLGLVILKKVQLANGIPTLTDQHDGWLCTYYVYDDFNRLRFTITPEGVDKLQSNNWVMTSAIANDLCFQTEYDDLGRPIMQKAPGKGQELIVYDRRNRPVLLQDANMKAKSPDEWLATFYDDLDRPVLTGIYESDNSRATLQGMAENANTVTTINTTYGGTVKIWALPIPVSDVNNSSVFTQLTFTFYDSYGFTGAKTFNASHADNLSYKNSGSTGNVESSSKTSRTLGLPTGHKERVLDGNTSSPTFLNSTVFFDEEGRVLQGQKDNIKSGVDISSMQYHFDGRVLSQSQTHNAPGTPYTNYNILTKYKYDKVGLLIKLGKKFNDPSRSYSASSLATADEDDDAGYKMIASYSYNELGKRTKKTLSPDYNNGAGLETEDFSYNFKGWLTGINKDYALNPGASSQWDHFFGIALGFENSDAQFSGHEYNGAVTGVLWKSQGDNVSRKYDYVYDNANRLIGANYLQKDGAGGSWSNGKMDFSTKEVSYDLNGNLESMTQMGVLPGASAPLMVDKLLYTYRAHSNLLARVDDLGSAGSADGKNNDFKDGSNAPGTDDYDYDDNGNLVLDNNKGVTAIQYNHLDKPELITIAAPQGSTGGGTIQYIYSASGKKIKKIVSENPSATNNNQTTITTTTYIDDYTYQAVDVAGVTNDYGLVSIAHEEGRIRVITPYNNPADPANEIGGGITLLGGKQGVFDYFITDHLANVRATITEEVNKAASVCTMEDANTQVKQYEESVFGNPGGNNEVNNSRFARPNDWTSGTPSGTPLSSNEKVSKLQALAGIPQTGPNTMLKVMAGDKISARVDYYYVQDPGPQIGTGLSTLLQNLGLSLGGALISPIIADNKTAIAGLLNNDVPLQDMFEDNSAANNPNADAPRAYLNYVFFDEQFNFVKEISGFKRVSQSGDGATPLVVTDVKAIKNGYVYVYLSNESGEPVYFDNFAVSQEKGRLIADDHYYAFGLKIKALSSKAISSSINKRLPSHGYQGLFSEEVEDFELSYNEFGLRVYDPQIGRWNSQDPYQEFASPYTGMGNNPANSVDPSGGTIAGAIVSAIGKAIQSIFGASAALACPIVNGATQQTTVTASTIVAIAASSLAVAGATASETFQQLENRSMSSLLQGQTFGGNSNSTSQSTDNSASVISSPSEDPAGSISNELNNTITLDAGSDTPGSGGENNNGDNDFTYHYNGAPIEKQQAPIVIDNNEDALHHYYKGKGEPVIIGPNTMNSIINSPEFRRQHHNIITGKEPGKKGGFKVDMTQFVPLSPSFHIGRTWIKWSVERDASGKSSVTYRFFDTDGFWDVDFLLERTSNALGEIYKFFDFPEYRPDGMGPNLEDDGGHPYPYIPAVRTFRFTRP